MRKIEREVIGAFIRGENRKSGNTEADGRFLRLHGHVIAVRGYGDGLHGDIYGCLAGYPTRTTRSCLNALATICGGVGVYQRDHGQFLATGEPLDSREWFRIA